MRFQLFAVSVFGVQSAFLLQVQMEVLALILFEFKVPGSVQFSLVFLPSV